MHFSSAVMNPLFIHLSNQDTNQFIIKIALIRKNNKLFLLIKIFLLKGSPSKQVNPDLKGKSTAVNFPSTEENCYLKWKINSLHREMY